MFTFHYTTDFYYWMAKMKCLLMKIIGIQYFMDLYIYVEELSTPL